MQACPDSDNMEAERLEWKPNGRAGGWQRSSVTARGASQDGGEKGSGRWIRGHETPCRQSSEGHAQPSTPSATAIGSIMPVANKIAPTEERMREGAISVGQVCASCGCLFDTAVHEQ